MNSLTMASSDSYGEMAAEIISERLTIEGYHETGMVISSNDDQPSLFADWVSHIDYLSNKYPNNTTNWWKEGSDFELVYKTKEDLDMRDPFVKTFKDLTNHDLRCAVTIRLNHDGKSKDTTAMIASNGIWFDLNTILGFIINSFEDAIECCDYNPKILIMPKDPEIYADPIAVLVKDYTMSCILESLIKDPICIKNGTADRAKYLLSIVKFFNSFYAFIRLQCPNSKDLAPFKINTDLAADYIINHDYNWYVQKYGCLA